MHSDALNPLGRLVPEQRLQDLEKLIQVVTQINRSLDPEDVLTTSLTGVQSVLDADFGCFVLVDPDTHTIKLERCDSVPDSFHERLEQLTLDFHPQTDFDQPEDRVKIVFQIGRRLSAVFENEDTSHSVLIPLLTHKQLIGVLLFGVVKQKLLAPKSVDLLMSIGEQVAMAIENAWLHSRLKKSEEWHRKFIENSSEAFWEVDAHGRILFVNHAACQMIGLERHEILQKHPGDFFIYDDQAKTAAKKLLQEKGVWFSPHSRLRTANGQIKLYSLTTIGIFDSAGKIQRYQTIFHDVTEREQLLESLQQRNKELAALNAIAEILSNPLEIGKALDQVCERVISITGMETMAIYLIDESAMCVNLLAYRGFSDALLSQVRSLGLDDPATRQIMASGEPFVLSDKTYPADGFAGPRADGYLAGISVPLHRRGNLVGALLVGSKTKHEFGQSDVELMQNISRQIGVALDNANLYAQMQRRVQELDGLTQLSAACSGSFDPLALSQIAVAWTLKLLQPHYTIVRLLDDRGMRLAASRTPPGIQLLEYMPSDEVFGPIFQTQSHLIIPNVETSDLPVMHRQGFLGAGMRAIAIVPMPARDRMIGALAIAYQEPHVWQLHEIDLLQTIANQIAGAIDSAQLFQNVSSEQRKVQAIFDSGLSGLFATDAAGRIVMFNRAAERITGWTLKDIKGFTWHEIFSDPTQTPPIEPLINEALLRKKTVFVFEGRSMRTHDGRIIPIAKAIAPLLDDTDNVTGAVGAFWDLTREHAAEIERDAFVRLAAHQIRTPLTALLSALQLYERPNLAEERRVEMWTLVMSQGERLRRFASQFLDFESTVKSERPLHMEPFPIVSTIRQLAKEFRADPGKHTFTIKPVKPEPMVYADLDRVEHILRNLLDNAVNYSPNGSKIKLAVSIAENNRILVSVKDEGPGIPLAEQENIFKPFYRSPDTTSQSAYGHGLGLSIARGFAREMGGDIWVESGTGRGATFHVTLRRYQ